MIQSFVRADWISCIAGFSGSDNIDERPLQFDRSVVVWVVVLLRDQKTSSFRTVLCL